MHEAEINHTNVLGSKGRVAEAYGELMSDMWIGTKRKTAPFNIKKSIGNVVAQFRGYNQQDSHEFLHYLIDILNEDLNRVKEKPYIEIPDSAGREDSIVSKEQWDAFTKRNDSIMVDIFYGQLKSHLVCLQCDHISNTFDPFSILSVPVPVVKIVKLKITYVPNQVSHKNTIRNFEIYVNDNLCLTEVEKMIKSEVEWDGDILFYTYTSHRIGKRLKKGNHVCRELVGEPLAAFPYKVEDHMKTANLYIMDTYVKKQVKKALFFNGEDQVCMPFVMIVDGRSTCREIQLQVFKFLFPILPLPAGIKNKIKDMDEDDRLDRAYQLLFEESNYADEELYELQLVNNRESGEGCPNCRKPHKYNCKLDYTQKSYKSFLNSGQSDPEVCILWKMNTKVDLSPLEKPEKIIIGEAEKSKKSKKIDLDMCLDSFRTDEILDGDNKWY